ncbi:hypothetical protein GKIL_0393 [Gloeobacter kilaueensis JS1]|uniref:Uncharacterized protein n=1 Tax=Gloeobacter kilaueensis (strain ATCC BAA-2537 / CCAP 1431/1 / ULC 316 / JS1) TaxID=1183438 RepID=U5QG35_GLOK1|nr:hypothetical protein GKIL_0393 [Gloeobacter kilaueensis JS1]
MLKLSTFFGPPLRLFLRQIPQPSKQSGLVGGKISSRKLVVDDPVMRSLLINTKGGATCPACFSGLPYPPWTLTLPVLQPPYLRLRLCILFGLLLVDSCYLPIQDGALGLLLQLLRPLGVLAFNHRLMGEVVAFW